MSKHRKEMPEDRAMRAYKERMDRASERDKVKYKPFEKPYCQSFNDLMDGFTIHAPECPDYQRSWVDGYRCINLQRGCAWPAGLANVR